MTEIPTPKFEVNFEDDALQAHPAYLESLGPLGWWRLNELSGTNANDQGSANLDATYSGGYTLGAEGAWTDGYDDMNTAVEFNGTTGSAATAADATWQNLYEEWTIGAWVYATATRANGTFDFAGIVAVGQNPVSTNPYMPFYLVYGKAGTRDNKVWAGYNDASANIYFAEDPTTLTLNTWVFLVATFENVGKTISLYRDGVLVDTTVGGTANVAAPNTRTLRIGHQNWITATNGTGQFFPGRIQDAFVFDRVLNDVEIANLHRYFTVNEPDPANYIDLTAEPDTKDGQTLNRLRGFAPRRGRSDPVNRIEAGTATVVLGNNDGLLSPAPIVNMLPNPSFEFVQTGLPFKGQDATLAFDTSNVRSGRRSLKITTGAATPGYATTQQDGLIGLRPGKTYTFSGYVYFGGGVTASNIRLEIVDEIAGVQTVTASSSPSVTGDRVSVTRTIPDTADASYLRVRLNEASDDIWIDDAQLEEAGSASAFVYGDSADAAWLGEANRSPTVYRTGGYAKAGLPMRACRLIAEWDGDDYDVFHGYVEQMQFEFPASGHDAKVTYSVVDGTRVLANLSMRGFSRSAERSGDRIRAILAWAGVGDDRIAVDDEWIDTLALDSVATVDDDRSALSMIREVEETERGEFFVSRSGLFTYQGSLFRSTGQSEVVVFSDEDDSAEIRYSDVALKIDIGTVANDVNIENVASGNVHEFNYPLSQSRYFPISRSEQSLWDQDEATDEDRSFPMPNAEKLTVLGTKDPDNWWPTLLSLELGDLVRVERHHAGEDLWQGYVHFLEGYSVNAAPGQWTMDFLTSPALAHPISPDPWQTPISRPLLFTSKAEASYGGGTITMPLKTYKAGRLYLFFTNLWATAGAGTPSQPGLGTSGNTWTSRINATSSSARHEIFSTVVGGADVTEALQVTFASVPPGAQYDIVIVEIADGFDATPIGDTNTQTVLSQQQGYIDVGTLTDAESIILASAGKAAADTAQWAGGLTLYNRAGPGSTSYSVAYGRVPGVDRMDISYVQGNGWGALGIEVEAQ